MLWPKWFKTVLYSTSWVWDKYPFAFYAMNRSSFIYIIGIFTVIALGIIDCYDIYKERSGLSAFVPYIISGIYFILTIAYWLVLERVVVKIEKQNIQGYLNMALIASMGTILLIMILEWIDKNELIPADIQGTFSFSNNLPFILIYLAFIVLIALYLLYVIKIGNRLEKIEKPKIKYINELGFAFKYFTPIGVLMSVVGNTFGLSGLDYIGLVLGQISGLVLIIIYWEVLRNSKKLTPSPELQMVKVVDPDSEFPNAD